MWNHKSAGGFLGFMLIWLTFFAVVGAATTHPPPHSLPVAVGDGVRESAIFLWHCVQAVFTGN